MDSLAQIGLAFGAFALGMLSLGPNILSVIGASMAQGRKAGIALAMGISAGSLLWASMTAIGLTALIAAYAAALTIIKIVGGLYLLWLSLKAFRSAASSQPMRRAGADEAGHPALFLRGLVVQMTNPKAALTWLAIMSIGLPQSAPAYAAVVIVAGTTVLSVVGHVAYAVAFSNNVVVGAYGRARRWIDAALGVFFGLAGLKLLSGRA